MKRLLFILFLLSAFVSVGQKSEVLIGVGLSSHGGNTPASSSYQITSSDGTSGVGQLYSGLKGRGVLSVLAGYAHRLYDHKPFFIYSEARFTYNNGTVSPGPYSINGEFIFFPEENFHTLYFELGVRFKGDFGGDANLGWNIQAMPFLSYFAYDAWPAVSYDGVEVDMNGVITNEYYNRFTYGVNLRFGYDWEEFGLYVNLDRCGNHYQFEDNVVFNGSRDNRTYISAAYKF